jgi:hypothetical protein
MCPDLVDRVLDRYQTQLGPDAGVYRGHVLRGFHYQKLLLGKTPPDAATLAWAVHDLGIWTAGTFDYLDPSVHLVSELAEDFGVRDADTARAMIAHHHKLRRADGRLVETFRQADLIDVSRGVLRAGLTREQIHEIVAAFPYLGFHRWLSGGLIRYGLHHPIKPLPMMRW